MSLNYLKISSVCVRACVRACVCVHIKSDKNSFVEHICVLIYSVLFSCRLSSALEHAKILPSITVYGFVKCSLDLRFLHYTHSMEPESNEFCDSSCASHNIC